MYTAEITSAQRLVDVKVGELIRSPGSKRYALKESKIYPAGSMHVHRYGKPNFANSRSLSVAQVQIYG